MVLAMQTIFYLTPLVASLESTYPTTPTPFTVPVTNDLAHQRYNISISTGNPPQSFDLLLDTGSTDIWFPLPNSTGCAPSCAPGYNLTLSSSLVNTTIPFDARYGLTPDLAVLGYYYNDTVSVDGLPVIKNMTFGINNVPQLLTRQGNWGIFGLGSRFMEAVYGGPTSPFRGKPGKIYIPLWERLALMSPGGKRVFSVWLNAQNAERGSVLFGGVDEKKHTGELKRVPLNLEGGERLEWSINVSSVSRVRVDGYAGGKETVTRLTPANYSLDYTFDTGSPNMYVPTTLYEAITADLNVTERINEASYVPCRFRDASSGFLDFGFRTTDSTEKEKDGGVTIRVSLGEIIYPYGFPVTWPLVPDRNGEKMCYFGIVPNDGPVRLLGATFIRSAYAVFDGEANEVGLAQSKWSV